MLWLVIFLGIIGWIGTVWILPAVLYGLPTVVTSPERIRAALRLADLQAGRPSLTWDVAMGGFW